MEYDAEKKYPKDTVGYYWTFSRDVYGVNSRPTKWLEKKANEAINGMDDLVIVPASQALGLLHEMWIQEKYQNKTNGEQQMKPSKECYDLIKDFEGLRFEAYVDPGTGNEPITIGWGTTSYGALGLQKYKRTKVKMGDTLTEAECQSELVFDVESTANVVLNQVRHQDFTQNEFDALVSFFFNLSGSDWGPQIKRLQDRNYDTFAEMLLHYINKGTPVEAGLLRRRKREQELFLRQTKEAEPRNGFDEITWFGLFVSNNSVVVVGYAGSKAICKWVDIKNKIQLSDIFSRCKNANNIIPILDKFEPEVPNAPGSTMEDKPQIDFSVARLTKDTIMHTGKWKGLQGLSLWVGTEHFSVASGAVGKQNFRLPSDRASVPGNLEPIPQGDYTIGQIAWADGKDNYDASHGAGLGPVWVPLTATFRDDRGAFGAHGDWNIDTARGSAGCVVFKDIPDLKRFVAALRKYEPKILSVDWNL